MSRVRTSRRWLAIAAVVALVAAAVIVTIVVTTTGGGGGSTSNGKGPRPVTSEEAERLASMFVKNFEAVGAAFDATVAVPQGVITLNGEVDFHTLTGYGEVSGGNDRSYTVEWDSAALLAWPSSGRPTEPPATLPSAAPRERALSPSTSGVDTMFALLLGLGRSQPDDADQVRQDGAMWLRSATLDGKTVDVMQGPQTQGTGHGSSTALDFWVDQSGDLLRVETFLGGSTSTSRVDLDTSSYEAFPTSTYLTGGR